MDPVMTENLLQIGEFAKQADTNLRTLRYYEELGLIQPTRRSSGKFRYYSTDQLKRVAAIKRLQGLGLSLQEVQDVMAPAQSEITGAMDRARSGLDKQIALVGQRLESLSSELQELKEARQKLDDCHTCSDELGSDACNKCAVSSPGAVAVLRSLL